MADIKQYTDQIKNAVYGEEVRDSIIGALEKVNDDNNSYQDIKDQITSDKEAIDRQVETFGDMVAEATETKAELNASVVTANTARTNLENATATANTAKTNLQTATTNANTAKANQMCIRDRSKGWLDLSGGDSKYTTYNAKIQESTHIFLCDYQTFKGLSGEWVWDTLNFISGEISTLTSDKKVDVTSENARMLIDGLIYQIMLIDDPMNLHQHLEIYLKFVGGQDG